MIVRNSLLYDSDSPGGMLRLRAYLTSIHLALLRRAFHYALRSTEFTFESCCSIYFAIVDYCTCCVHIVSFNAKYLFLLGVENILERNRVESAAEDSDAGWSATETVAGDEAVVHDVETPRGRMSEFVAVEEDEDDERHPVDVQPEHPTTPIARKSRQKREVKAVKQYSLRKRL